MKQTQSLKHRLHGYGISADTASCGMPVSQRKQGCWLSLVLAWHHTKVRREKRHLETEERKGRQNHDKARAWRTAREVSHIQLGRYRHYSLCSGCFPSPTTYMPEAVSGMLHPKYWFSSFDKTRGRDCWLPALMSGTSTWLSRVKTSRGSKAQEATLRQPGIK